MIKLITRYIVALSLFTSIQAVAGYITTDLTEDTYITYKGFDWTWASSVNITNYEEVDFFTSSVITNTFEDNSAHSGWMSFEAGSDLDIIFQELTLFDFVKGDTIIHSFSYWNSYFTEVDDIFKQGSAAFNPVLFGRRLGEKDDTVGINTRDFETFYVRASVASVPEPTTLLIFGAGLLGLGIRKKIAK